MGEKSVIITLSKLFEAIFGGVLLAGLVLILIITPSEHADAQAVESMQERRAKEAAAARRKHTDSVLSHAQRWNRSKEQNRASKFAESRRELREQRLNEIAYIYGDLIAELPENSVLINRPYPSEFAMIGKRKPKYDLDSDIAGGIALKLNVRKLSKNKPQQIVVSETISDIERGDVLCLTFWARSSEKNGESITGFLPELGVRRAAAPFQPIASRSAGLDEYWSHFSFMFESPESLENQQAQVYFKLGEKKQKIELGPAYLFKLGQVDPSSVSARACSA